MIKTRIIKTLVLAILFLTITSAIILEKPVNAQSSLTTIIIQPDGSISPNNVPIERNGDTYTFTNNIYSAIKILKSDIIINGAGYTLTGSFNGNSTDIWVVGTGPDPNSLDYYTIGVDLGNNSVNGITIENLNIENFSIGMYIWTQNNTIIGNAFSRNIVGLLLSGSNATVTKNYMSNNIEGLFFGFNAPGTFPPDMKVYQNAFVDNNVQLSGCQCKAYNLSETPHDWDNGKKGNYWSNYNGTDTNRDGVGDTMYTIDALDHDRFPLIVSPIKPPVPAGKFPVEAVVFGFSAPVLLAASAFAVRHRRKQKIAKEP